MAQKSKKRPPNLKKALPLLPEEERELFPNGKPEDPDKLMRDAGDFSLFMNRNLFTKRAFFLIRNYWRLGEKVLAIGMTLLYILPVVVMLALGFIMGANETQGEGLAVFSIPMIVIFIVWIAVYYLAPNVMVWHQKPLYEFFKQDYNAVRHEFLETPIKRKR